MFRARDVTAKLNPQATTFAVNDPYMAWFDGDQYALSVQIGSTSGNIVTIAARNAQTVNVADDDRDGLIVDGIDISLNEPENDVDNNYAEFTITVS